MAADIVGISSMATRQILAERSSVYRQKTGRSVAIESVGGVDAARRILSGEKFDIVVLADDAMKKLEEDGFLKPGSRAGFADSAIAVAVRSGAKRPDLSNEAATKAAVLSSQSIGYSTGPSGTHVLKLLEKWDADQSKSVRIIQAPPGVPVGTLVARGDAELGFQQLSEFLDVPGIDIIGALPQEIQSLTRFSCGVGALASDEAGARDFIGYLTSAEADASIRRHGMEPAHPRS
ncbi:substrate-binding domain-containing protein [Bradyrhizobium sp.]|jgi:molybdate transport system substrate-binding protein|uniref:substrate-binding domain-containing protein n=1 Tax=Bradyrhizobium sp. TaxID=376 RepID=UPI003BB10E5E